MVNNACGDFANHTLETLNKCISELDQIKELFLNNPEIDFSRTRKISFESFIRCCLQMEGSTLQNELLKFFRFDDNTPTKELSRNYLHFLNPRIM